MLSMNKANKGVAVVVVVVVVDNSPLRSCDLAISVLCLSNLIM